MSLQLTAAPLKSPDLAADASISIMTEMVAVHGAGLMAVLEEDGAR